MACALKLTPATRMDSENGLRACSGSSAMRFLSMTVQLLRAGSGRCQQRRGSEQDTLREHALHPPGGTSAGFSRRARPNAAVASSFRPSRCSARPAW